jgi:hypothetical protein
MSCRYCAFQVGWDILLGTLNVPFRYDLRRISNGNTPTTQAPIDKLGWNGYKTVQIPLGSSHILHTTRDTQVDRKEKGMIVDLVRWVKTDFTSGSYDCEE